MADAARRGAWLALHTTEATGALAVWHDGIETVCELQAGQHAATLLGAVETQFARAGLTVAQLQGITVSVGPGSFTGIRIGVATAQGLALAAGIPVHVCDSLLAEAVACRRSGPVAVVLDARRGQVYAAVYRCHDQDAHPLLAPFVDDPVAAGDRIARALSKDSDVRVTGSGATLLPAIAVGQTEVVPPVARADVARALLQLGRNGRLTGLAPHRVEPLYLRKSDAELNREARGRAR